MRCAANNENRILRSKDPTKEQTSEIQFEHFVQQLGDSCSAESDQQDFRAMDSATLGVLTFSQLKKKNFF